MFVRTKSPMIRQFPPIIYLLLLSALFGACKPSIQKDNLEAKSDDLTQRISFSDGFHISIPSYFVEMNDINPNAIVQFGSIGEVKDSLSDNFEDEIYLTIMELSKANLKNTFADSGRITLNKVNDRTAINLELILEEFKVSHTNPKPEIINGLAAIQNEFSGRLGQYKVYYKMGIYETRNHFYQLLTWCMQKHVQKHKAEMDKIIHSFENE